MNPPPQPNNNWDAIQSSRGGPEPPAHSPVTSPAPVPSRHFQAPQRLSGSAVASFLCGILSFFVPILGAIPAVILGFVGLADVRQGQGQVGGKGMAIAGMALSAASTALTCLFVPLFFLLLWRAEPPRQQFEVIGNERSAATPRPVSFREPPPATDFPGLLAYWDLDEGSGNRAADKSGQNNHGTLHGPKWVAGVRGAALRFHGSSDYVDYGGGAGLNFAADAPFTYCGWFKTSADVATILSQRNEKDGGPDIDFNLTGGQLEVVVRQDGGEFGTLARVSSKERLNDGFWHPFALTRNPGGRIDLYIHGSWKGSETSPHAGGAITTNLRALGCERYWVKRDFQSNERCYLRGDLDEVCIFNRALSTAEIKKLAGQ